MQAPRRPSARATGSIVAGLLPFALLVGVSVLEPFGWSGDQVLERPDVVAVCLAVSMTMGWWLAVSASHGGWLRTAGVGIGLGLLWGPVIAVVMSLSVLVDGLVRGTVGPIDGAGTVLIWALYGLVVFQVFVSAVAVPVGVVWAFGTRSVVRTFALWSGPRRPGRPVAGALVAIGLVGGLAQGVGAQPPGTHCLDLEGYATDAAFSPNGDLLAIGTQADPNEPGTVLLISWPSGEEIARWTAWTDEEVTVSPEGTVYWSAWVLGLHTVDDPAATEGVYEGRSGSEPTWFATGFETPLNDLTWTVNGLRGTTPNSHRVATVGRGDTAPRFDAGYSGDEVGAFWTSPDGLTTAIGPAWDDQAVEIRSPSGTRRFDILGDPRTIAITADGRTMIATSWFDGTRAIDIETGASRLLIRGSQRFATVSPGGQLVWVNDEPIGDGRVCTAPLEVAD